jgi:hypothetical protein
VDWLDVTPVVWRGQYATPDGGLLDPRDGYVGDGLGRGWRAPLASVALSV